MTASSNPGEDGRKKKTEIWPRPDSQCPLPNLPIDVYGAVGFWTAQGPTVCGGFKEGGKKCFVFTEHQWKPWTNMETARAFTSALQINPNQVLIIGGQEETRETREVLETTELISSSGSEEGNRFPVTIARHCSFKINATHAMVTGGHQDGSKDASSTWFVDLTTTTVTPGPALKTGRAHHGCTIFQHRTKSFGIVAGGHVSGSSRGCERPRCGYLDSTEMIDLDEESPKWTEGMQDKSKIVYL